MPENTCVHRDSGRRHFLQTVLSSAVVGFAAQAGIEFASPEKLSAQTNLSPDAALKELLPGNQPFAAVLACADSRVPVELVFDQTIGHIFVTRVAGNIVTPEIIASLEYGVAVLGVKTLVVLGHSSCGAVKAAMKADAVPGQISTLYPHLRQAVQQSDGNFAKAIEANAKIQAELLRTSSTVIRDAVKAGKLKVEAGVYDLATGKVTLI